MNRALVALSGGIDSAAVTLVLREAGYQVQALYIDMLGDRAMREKAIDMARRLDVKLHIEDVQSQFKSLIVDFTLAEHQSGRTASPCAVCNPAIKWATLLTVADRLGIEKIATGHYVRIEHSDGEYFINKGVDPSKDQSYYLWALDQRVLSRAITPLGSMTKREVREYLLGEGFSDLSSSGESMGLCFMQGRSYADFLRHALDPKKGDVVDPQGQVVGDHDGYQLYTIGQKRGFRSVAPGEVRRIDPTSNQIEIGSALMCTELCVENFVLHEPLPLNLEGLTVKIRGIGRNPQGGVRLDVRGDRLHITLEKDEAWAVCAGQPVVIYRADRVVGGGILC